MDEEYERFMQEYFENELFDDFDDQIPLMAIRRMRRRQQNETSTVQRHRRYIDREREAGYERILRDYFVDNPVYSEEMFRRRFQMTKGLFLRIFDALQTHFEYFQWRFDAIGRRCLSLHQKCTAAIR